LKKRAVFKPDGQLFGISCINQTDQSVFFFEIKGPIFALGCLIGGRRYWSVRLLLKLNSSEGEALRLMILNNDLCMLPDYNLGTVNPIESTNLSSFKGQVSFPI